MTNEALHQTVASILVAELQGREDGHCVRVDYLERNDAIGVCRALRVLVADLANPVAAFVLSSGLDTANKLESELLIHPDHAIERRNRKDERLCIFIPADIVDAAASSLSNAFAPQDGRELQSRALEVILGTLDPNLVVLVRRCFLRLRGALRTTDANRLEFLQAAMDREASGEIDSIGLDLWMIGLIPDARPNFVDSLEANGRCVLELSRPGRIQAPLRDRIQRLSVDHNSASHLLLALDRQPLADVRTWANDLIASGWTFDHWVFPALERSDLRDVVVKPFLDSNGVVKKGSKLRQPDGPNGALVAEVGPKQKITVGWTAEPVEPNNVSRWRIEVAPVSGDMDDATASLPSREIAGNRYSTNLSLDLDLDIDQIPNSRMCIRVSALDMAGNEIFDEHEEPIFGTSEEFYLTEGGEAEESSAQRLKTVPTISFGRIQLAVSSGTEGLEEGQPHWLERDLDYFALSLNERTLIRVGVPAPLRLLATRVLANSPQGGRFQLLCEDSSVVSADAFEALEPPQSKNTAWGPFWRARETFFQRIRRAEVRNVVEAADWTPELSGAAVRYAQTYRDLVDALATSTSASTPDELRGALSIDTISVRAATTEDETALVVLPTHPLRAGWYANYAELLKRWEASVSELTRAGRRNAVDLALLESISPSNTPPFAYWPNFESPFVFFQNLRFFYGVALPPGAADPHRRFADIAQVLGAGKDSSSGDFRPERLSEHLSEYQAVHPYVERLHLTLVNPDRGELVADTLDSFLRNVSPVEFSESSALVSPATFKVQAYVAQGTESPLQGLDRIRHLQSEEYSGGESDFFSPSLESAVQTMAALDNAVPSQAHVAIISDIAEPRIVTVPKETQPVIRTGFSLYGLIARFVSTFSGEGDTLRWLHQLHPMSDSRSEPHPAGPRFGEVLIELHEALLRAGAILLNGTSDSLPALEVCVTPDRRRLLETVHQQSDWVINIDRFFGPDYYDSPQEPHLAQAARNFILDYSPEFTEGLGHRVTVTTAWQEDVLQRLGHSMRQIGLSPTRESVEYLLSQIKVLSGRVALRALVAELGES